MDYEVKDFSNDVIKRSFDVPVLVDFWAEWCGPCKMLSPVLENLAERFKGEWELVKVDTDKNQEIASQYGIRGIPNVKLFSEGNVIDEFTGALPEHMILNWLKKSVPGKNYKKIEEAISLLSNGNSEEAEKILRDIISSEPDNEQAKVLLAKELFFNKPETSVKLIEDIDEFSDYFETADALKTFNRLFEHRKNSLPESEVKNSYIKAADFLKNKDFDSALSNFIDVIRAYRYYDDDGARKACIAIFKYLGEENKITQKHRRDFSSALYV